MRCELVICCGFHDVRISSGSIVLFRFNGVSQPMFAYYVPPFGNSVNVLGTMRESYACWYYDLSATA